MAPDSSNRPYWPSRLFALAFYFGLAPLLALPKLHRRSDYLQHHLTQSIGIVGLLAFLVLSGVLGFVALAFLIVFAERIYLNYSLDSVCEIVFGVVLILWLLLWLWGIALALMGSTWPMPRTGRLQGRGKLFRLALLGNIAIGLVVLTTSAMAIHASSITRSYAGPARVYMLYDSYGMPVPRWVFALGFYRIALESNARWGPNSVVVAPLTEANVHQAMKHGHLVFLASHGKDGVITTPNMLLYPEFQNSACRLWSITRSSTDAEYRGEDARTVEQSENLTFVYVTACKGGEKANFWKSALAPAEVRTFPRTSAVGEHILWMWTAGPRRVREIE